VAVNIFNINIEDMLDMQEVIFEVYIEDKLTNRQQMQAPKEMLIANFLQTAKQMKNDRRPIKIKMIRPEVIWDEFDKKQKVLNNEIELSNDAMVAWEANRNAGEKND
jgi:hypothetical protein